MRAVSRPLVVVAVIVVLAFGALYVISFSGLLSSKQIKVVNVDIPPYIFGSGYTFSPRNVTVVVGVNNTVTWTNRDNRTHWIVEGPPTYAGSLQYTCSVPLKGTSSPRWCPLGYPLFDSGDIKAGSTFTYTFTAPGVHEYFDAYNTFYPMIGFVVVK